MLGYSTGISSEQALAGILTLTSASLFFIQTHSESPKG